MPADGILERRLQKLRHKKDWRRLFCKLVSTAIVVYLLFGVIFGIAIVQGDSMTGSRIYDGDLVYVKSCSDVENGDIAVVLLNHSEVTIKKILKRSILLF